MPASTVPNPIAIAMAFVAMVIVVVLVFVSSRCSRFHRFFLFMFYGLHLKISLMAYVPARAPFVRAIFARSSFDDVCGCVSHFPVAVRREMQLGMGKISLYAIKLEEKAQL